MLEYLFSFIEHNITLIFLIVLAFGIASAYFKSIKILFLSLLGLSTLYFALLCLYRLGFGIAALYEWSCNYVLLICNHIDAYGLIIFHHSFVVSRAINGLLYHPIQGGILCFFQLVLFMFIILSLYAITPRIKGENFKKVKIRSVIANKNKIIYNTINKTQSKFILNSVFRC